jgi:hypothetical protein
MGWGGYLGYGWGRVAISAGEGARTSTFFFRGVIFFENFAKKIFEKIFFFTFFKKIIFAHFFQLLEIFLFLE